MIYLSEQENRKLKVHKDISSRFKYPYWSVEVNREPKFPSDQYGTPIRNQSDKTEIYKPDDVQYQCGYCTSDDTELIWADMCMSNAGGWKSYEFRCRRCGVYTYYEEREFS